MRNRLNVIILLCSFFLTILLPLVMLPLNVLGMVFAKDKIRKAYGLLTAFSLAMVAYIWVPGPQMDLYRHHQQAQLLAGFNIQELGTLIVNNLEPLHYLIKFTVAQIGDYNLLQFIVILFSYYGLFWLICDIADSTGIKKTGFLIMLLYSFFAVKFIDFASGLWFNFALINLTIGIYYFYFKGKKTRSYLFYFVAACLHTGVLFIIIPTIVISHFNTFKKFRFTTVFGIFLTFLLFGTMLSLLSGVFGPGNRIIDIANQMYNSYYVNGSRFDNLHTGWNLFFPIVNIVFSIIMAIMCLKRNELKKYSCFTLYILMCVLASLINAGIFVRYGFFAAMLAIPFLADFIKTNRNKQLRSLIIISIAILVLLEVARWLSQAESAGLLSQIKDSVTSSTFEIIGGNND